MGVMIAGLVLFLGIHLVPVAQPLRARLITIQFHPAIFSTGPVP